MRDKIKYQCIINIQKWLQKWLLNSNKNVMIIMMMIIIIIITIMIIERKITWLIFEDVTATTSWSSHVTKISKLYFKVPFCFIILTYLPFCLYPFVQKILFLSFIPIELYIELFHNQLNVSNCNAFMVHENNLTIWNSWKPQAIFCRLCYDKIIVNYIYAWERGWGKTKLWKYVQLSMWSWFFLRDLK